MKSIFNDSKYTDIYYKIIENAISENRKRYRKSDSRYEYYESHHIIPKSIIMNDDTVLLLAKEHFICHLLLTKMVTGNNKRLMSYALWGMTNQKSHYQVNRYTSRSYTYAKKLMIRALSEDRKGKTLEELHGKDKAKIIREKFKTRKPRSSPDVYEKQQISERVKTASIKNPWTRHFETGSLPKKLCEKCNKLFDLGNYAKHHGKKCQEYESKIVCPNCQNLFVTKRWEKRKYCSSKCANQHRWILRKAGQ